MMIGKSLPTPPERTTESKQNNVLDIKNLPSRNEDGRESFTDISFKCKKSEIFGNSWCRR